MNSKKPNSTMIILLLCLISTAARFVIDSFLPSIPAMGQALHVTGNQIQLTLTLYFLGFGISQLIYGPLSDRWGRKPILILGLLLFICANTISIFVSSLTIILVARFIGGFGIGACGLLNRAIANDCFTDAFFSRAWSYTTTALVLVLILAPLIGSIIQQNFNWQANFIVAIAYITATLIIVIWKLPETNINHRLNKIKIDNIIQSYKYIISMPSFIVCTLCYTLAFSGLIAYFQVSPLLLMDVFDLSPMQYGETSVLIACCYLLGGQIVNRLSIPLGTYRLLLIGIFMLFLSSFGMLLWNDYYTPTLISTLLPISLYVIGARIVIPNALAGAFTNLKHLGGTTSGLIGCIQMLGSAAISYILSLYSYQTPGPLALLLTGISFTCLLVFQSYALFNPSLFVRGRSL